MWYGSNVRGGELAPATLTSALKNTDLWKMVVDESTIPIQESVRSWKETHFLDEIVDADKKLAEKIVNELQANRFVLTIGGDHALGLGSVSGSLQYDANIGLIWFDAHGDMNTEETSPTGHIHGMPVAALMGLCKSELNNVAPVKIKPENIFWIGTRELDKGEQELAERLHLNVYSTELIHKRGMADILNEVRIHMEKQGIKHIHLSFDVDAFDPELFPATGVKVPNGLNMDDFEQFVKEMDSLPNICTIDFVEYNPTMEKKDTPYDCERKSVSFIINLLRNNFV